MLQLLSKMPVSLLMRRHMLNSSGQRQMEWIIPHQVLGWTMVNVSSKVRDWDGFSEVKLHTLGTRNIWITITAILKASSSQLTNDHLTTALPRWSGRAPQVWVAVMPMRHSETLWCAATHLRATSRENTRTMSKDQAGIPINRENAMTLMISEDNLAFVINSDITYY